ncbi:SWIM zinc finger family protein [Wolbachia endosymbiont (group A) of Anomoia purmunda]|uniref:SWIM zinc finger family protein n=1 Tax=Wolbachia endosymbiont (group A) of Anomoia purmunda TaxID=2953978 RepID=UPI00222F86D3|nr:SWIM zinc finger family protein [Wolbachia endosymbiont (group A) of Anomoia purmunda]
MKLNRGNIEDLVDEPYFSRGEFYFNHGLVRIISVSDFDVKSKVVGSRVYKVTLKYNGQCLGGECSCPAFENFGPCKHMAATGFALIQYNKQGYCSSAECSDRIDEQDRFEKLLLKKTKQEFVAIVIRLSDYCPEIIVDELEDEEDL